MQLSTQSLTCFILLFTCLSGFAAESPTGQAIYEQFCITCHQDGLVGAPKFESREDWQSRLSGKTMNDLVASAIQGLNAMPAQGTCTECSKEDIKAAILYMLPKS